MTKVFLALSLLFFTFFSHAQSNLSAGAQLLFKNVKCKLTPAEKNTLYQKIGFTLSKDKKQFISDGDTEKEYPFGAMVYPTDLNKDGKEEIFVVFGNSFTSGATGSNVVLFIPKGTGFQMEFGFPSSTPALLPAASLGYPDLVMGGPGFSFPVYRWNGKAYTLHRKISDQELEKKGKFVDEVSKNYTASIQ